MVLTRLTRAARPVARPLIRAASSAPARQHVLTRAAAGSYDLNALAADATFCSTWGVQKLPTPDALWLSPPSSTTDVFVFATGTHVGWGLPEDDEASLRAALAEVAEELPAACLECTSPLEERFSWSEAAVAVASAPLHVEFLDEVSLGTCHLTLGSRAGLGASPLGPAAAKLAASYCLAQSANMAVVEAAAERFLSRIRWIPADFAKDGNSSLTQVRRPMCRAAPPRPPPPPPPRPLSSSLASSRPAVTPPRAPPGTGGHQ